MNFDFEENWKAFNNAFGDGEVATMIEIYDNMISTNDTAGGIKKKKDFLYKIKSLQERYQGISNADEIWVSFEMVLGEKIPPLIKYVK